MVKTMSAKQKMGIASGLLLLAAVKVAMVFWWQHKQPERAAVAACDVAGAGCEFAAGQTLRLIGVGNPKTPFVARMDGLPDDAQSVSVSFDMRDMAMGFNRFDLRKQADGSWQAAPIYLPVCAAARHDWQVKWQVDGKAYQADFQTKP